MESSKKLVAVFLVCMVMLSSSVHVSKAHEQEKSNAEMFKEAVLKTNAEYTTCFNICEKTCIAQGLGYTHCEMKCDSGCNAKLLKGIYTNSVTLTRASRSLQKKIKKKAKYIVGLSTNNLNISSILFLNYFRRSWLLGETESMKIPSQQINFQGYNY